MTNNLNLNNLIITTNLRFLEDANNPTDTKDKINGWGRIELLSKAAQNIACG